MRLLVATVLLILALVFLAFGVPRIAGAGEAEPIRRVGKAEYGYGQIRFGGRGPEAWRWQLVKEKRRSAAMQRRLTARVLQVQSLRRQVSLLDRLNFDPVLAIRVVFGPNADEAIRVFECESHLRPWARNGQYLGIAQMGSYARSTYGHSSTALGQARAAFRYFVDAGWGPWECARIVGVR